MKTNPKKTNRRFLIDKLVSEVLSRPKLRDGMLPRSHRDIANGCKIRFSIGGAK